jgi:hypothetical protein
MNRYLDTHFCSELAPTGGARSVHDAIGLDYTEKIYASYHVKLTEL